MNYKPIKKTLPIDVLFEMLADAYFQCVSRGSEQPDKDALFVLWLALVGKEYGFKPPTVEQDMKATEQKSKNNARSQRGNSAKPKKHYRMIRILSEPDIIPKQVRQRLKQGITNYE